MSKIEWTEETINCVTGCTPVSSGCAKCYARRMTKRLQGAYAKKMENGEEPGELAKYKDGFDVLNIHPTAWAKVRSWRKPRRVFLNSMSDTFHPESPWWFIAWMFENMNSYPQHIFQVLTKRAKRMEDLINHHGMGIELSHNIWVGVSVENQDYIERIDYLAKIKAKVRFVSFEPLLGPIDLSEVAEHFAVVDSDDYLLRGKAVVQSTVQKLPFQWAIIGGESGPGARPMMIEWVYDLVRQCKSAGVAVFFKQRLVNGKKISCPKLWNRQWMEYPGG